MTEAEILRFIDEGANHYARMFGAAEHMETVNREYYSFIRPKSNEHGISFVFDLHLDNLPIGQRNQIVDEIKSLSMPVWVDLTASDELFFAVFGKEKAHGQTLFGENDEIYMALLSEQKIKKSPLCCEVVEVNTAEEFSVWAGIANDVLSGGYPDVHPIYHYQLCKNGLLKCYTAYKNGVPSAVAAIMSSSRNAASLEFVATIPEMRRKGLAKALCEKAVLDALDGGVKIITVRAANAAAGKLYQSIGFTAYNYAI